MYKKLLKINSYDSFRWFACVNCDICVIVWFEKSIEKKNQ